MERVVILDFSAILHKGYYALPILKNSKEQPVGAVLAFTNILMKIIRQHKPHVICAAYDVKRSTLNRREVFDGYKADRKAMPEDLVCQIDIVKNMLKGFNIDGFTVDGEEADDVIGSLAHKFANEGNEVIIVTGDKDISQVIDDGISISLLNKTDSNGKFKMIRTDEDVIDQLGVVPNMIPDLFGLVGDKCDGIPGVRKVGYKKAIQLLDRFGSVDGIYENIDSLSEVSGIGKGLIRNIVEDENMAKLSKELATIDCSLDVDITKCGNMYIDKGMLLELYQELELHSLIKRFGVL